MDVNGADRLAQTKFGDGYILSCRVYFVTGRYIVFLLKDILSCNLVFDL